MSDYIALDKIKEKIAEMQSLAIYEDSFETLRDVRTAIEALPAADVRPVVRGFWVEENGEDAHTGELWCIWKCSECGARRTAGWRHTQDGRKPRNNFCPDCGAQMSEAST